jgi:hypothetical protein
VCTVRFFALECDVVRERYSKFRQLRLSAQRRLHDELLHTIVERESISSTGET